MAFKDTVIAILRSHERTRVVPGEDLDVEEVAEEIDRAVKSYSDKNPQSIEYAFPFCEETLFPGGETTHFANFGLSKRELYATVAMHAMVSAKSAKLNLDYLDHCTVLTEWIPDAAKEIADRMCKQLEKDA